MATAPRITSPEVKTDVVIMDGGLNEAVSSIEMKPGELILCKNYYITEGSSGGYVSLSGYERFDGTPLASTVDGNEDDDAAREATRSCEKNTGNPSPAAMAIAAARSTGLETTRRSTAAATSSVRLAAA